MSADFLHNLRDLSAVPLRKGSLIPGLVFRSDDVCIIGEAQSEQLQARGIRDIIDFRGHDELSATGRGPLAPHTSHHHLPLVISGASGSFDAVTDRDKPFTAQEVGRWYFDVALASRNLIVRGLEIVTGSTGGLLFHCAAGKDRTGIFAACLLATVGATEDGIVRDFVATQDSVDKVYSRLRVSPYGFPLERFPHAGALLEAREETMITFLDLARKEWGGLDSLLVHNGLKVETVEALRDRLITDT